MTFARAQNISTLDPSRLVVSDFIQLGRAKWCIGVRYRLISIIYCRYAESAQRLPFPPKTCGFLYLHRPHNLHPCAATLRFRLCDAGLPPQESFARGKDLLLPKGKPWEMTLFKLFMSAYITNNFREGLLLDKVLSLEHIEQVEKIVHNRMEVAKRKNNWGSNLVYSFGQPFHVSMKQQRTRLNFMDLKMGKLHRVDIYTKIVGMFLSSLFVFPIRS
jgi:hypothetical protein